MRTNPWASIWNYVVCHRKSVISASEQLLRCPVFSEPLLLHNLSAPPDSKHKFVMTSEVGIRTWYGTGSVMSTNIRIFKYSNKMALEYYSYSYSCHFPSTNIFGYSFVDFWTTEYIRIFVHKFSKIRIYLNICSEPYFDIWLSIFKEKK